MLADNGTYQSLNNERFRATLIKSKPYKQSDSIFTGEPTPLPNLVVN